MKLKMFTVHDSKAEAYLQPFFMPSRGSAIRAFTDSVNDPNTGFNKHASDYTLCEIGEYDDATAQVTPSEPIIITNASDLLHKPIQQPTSTKMVDMKGDY